MTTFQAVPRPLFGGTGEGGKVKVVVSQEPNAAFDYINAQLHFAPALESPVFVQNADAFERQLEETQPDVVVIDSDYWLGQQCTPIQVVVDALNTGKIQELGVVVLAFSTDRVKQFIETEAAGLGDRLKVQYLTLCTQLQGNQVVRAIQAVDPSPEIL